MSNLNRILWSGLVLGIAACGDSVTVTQPPEPVPGIRSVTVAPDGATLGVGATLQMTAAVTTDPGAAAPTIAWTTSDAAKATVGATSGLVTGVAAGSVAIKATATVGTSTGSGQASVTIVATSAKVTGITVTPTGVSIVPDQEVVASANVSCTNCNNTTDKAVTWSSLSTAIATVDAGGKIKGVAVGSAVIKATSTLDASYSAAIAVTVVPAAAKATVSIQSITVNNGFNEVPANLAAVAGQMNVTLNLDRGDETVQKVQVFMDTQTGDSLVAEQVYASASAIELAAGVEPIKLSINTAYFGPVSGAPAFINREHTLKAKVVTLQNAQGSASNSVKLTLANSDTFGLTIVVTNGSSANDGIGQLWQTGDLEITALPIIYTTASPVIQQVVLTPSGFSGAPTVASRTLTASPYKATWLKANLFNAGTGTQGSGGIEVASGPTNGFTLGITSTLGGNVGPGGLITTGVRLDNKGPGSPTFWVNPNGRQNAWINGAVLLNTTNAADPNGWLVNGTADGGVGGYTRVLHIAASAAGTVAEAIAVPGLEAAILPAPSATNTAYCAVARANDKLGNGSTVPAATTACNPPVFAPDFATALSQQLIGVDTEAPTIAFSGGLGSNARINAAALGGEFQVTVADQPSAIGNSGMLSGGAVQGTIRTRNPGGSACFFPGTTACAPTSVNAAPPFPLVPTAGAASVAANTTLGYFTYDAFAKDAAGNSSAPVSRVVVRDNTPVVVSSPSVPVVITGAFGGSAFLNDDLSIWDYYWTAGYTTALIAPTTIRLALAPTAVDAYNSATLTNTNFAINTTINTYLGLQAAPGNVPAAYAPNSDPLGAINLFARDQTQPAYSTNGTPVAPTAPASGIAIANAAPLWNFNTYTPATTNALICAGQSGAPACGVTPTSTTFSVAASGTTATFPSPFTRVDFYAVNATGTDLIFIGSVASPSLVDNGATRVFTWSLPVTALSLYTTLGGVVPAVIGPVNVYAFGTNATGVALVSVAVAQTINP